MLIVLATVCCRHDVLFSTSRIELMLFKRRCELRCDCHAAHHCMSGGVTRHDLLYMARKLFDRFEPVVCCFRASHPTAQERLDALSAIK